MKKNLFRTILALTAALVLSLGCALGETAAAADPILLVTVNGDEIYDNNADMKDLVSYYSSYYASQGYDVTDPSMAAILTNWGMEWAIENTLYRQKAAEMGFTGLTDEEIAAQQAEVKAQWDSEVEAIMTQMGTVTEESTEEEKEAARQQALTYIESAYGYTEDSYIEQNLATAQLVAICNHVQKELLGEITVSAEEIQAAFDAKVESDKALYEGNAFMYEYYTTYMGETSYYVPEGYRGIIHILLSVDEDLMNNYTDLSARLEEQNSASETEATETTDTEAAETAEAEPTATPEPVTQDMVDAAKQAILDSVQSQVEEIVTKFNAGTSFEDLIAEYGTDPGMKDASNLKNGYLVHADSILFDPAFTAGAMTLEKVGDMSEPVIGTNGVHILYYLRDVPAGAVELTDEISQALEAELKSTKESEAAQNLVSQWIAESDIQYTEAGQAIVDEMNALIAQANAAEEGTETTESTESTESTEEGETVQVAPAE